MNPISGNKASVANFITKMTKNDAMAPIVALESVVVSGRTLQAYKRGKGDEARERFLEEISGSIVWLGGVRGFNALGDKIIEKTLKTAGKNFDVGTDKVLRTPFENFMSKAAPKGFSAKQIAMMKGAKVLASVGLANLLIGFVVPKMNHAITDSMRKKKHQKATQNNVGENISFKGRGINALNVFTNAIENTNTGKLLSTDAGTVSGRMYNARTKEERNEIAFRDIASIYFYMFAQGHIGKLLNKLESGKASRLDPTSVSTLDTHLQEFLKSHGNEMNVEEFKKALLGNIQEVKLPENIPFQKGEVSAIGKLLKSQPLEVAKISDIEQIITDADVLNRIKAMSKLQPEKLGEAIITKQQLIDALNNSEITNPQLLDKIYTEFTGGANKDEFKFVSNKKLEKLKSEMIEYIETICKEAKDGKINKDLLKKVKDKNMIYNGINFAAGFVVAAAFLSTFIPKIQYYITKKTTGVDEFPGTYDYEHHHKIDE